MMNILYYDTRLFLIADNFLKQILKNNYKFRDSIVGKKVHRPN